MVLSNVLFGLGAHTLVNDYKSSAEKDITVLKDLMEKQNPKKKNKTFDSMSFLKNQMVSASSNIKIVSDIISRICAGKLYNKDEEKGNFTPFNNFMLEKIVDLYRLYQNIEEVILPDFIEKDMNGDKDNA